MQRISYLVNNVMVDIPSTGECIRNNSDMNELDIIANYYTEGLLWP